MFRERVYVYGSHDNAGSDSFCDYKLKVWSASVDNLNNWVCHGDMFHTRPDRDHNSDVDWSDTQLYAPDVVEKDGKYYLFAYIVGSKGCVAVSDRPDGPFKLLSQYQYEIENSLLEEGAFVDPEVLVDNDGRVYIYCGYQKSYMAELKGSMYEVITDSHIPDIIPVSETEQGFFEACSMRKVGDTYYLIYSPKRGCRLDYMTSSSPTGPFTYGGTIIDNGVDYPGGNDHGSITSRRACVEKIELLPDGSIPEVEMTSLGFETSLNPYDITPAEIACVLKGNLFITEHNPFTRVITNIKKNAVIGYKYLYRWRRRN